MQFLQFHTLNCNKTKQNAHMNQHIPCYICVFTSSSFINISSFMWVSSSAQLISTTQYIFNSFLTFHFSYFPFSIAKVITKSKHFKHSLNM